MPTCPYAHSENGSEDRADDSPKAGSDASSEVGSDVDPRAGTSSHSNDRSPDSAPWTDGEVSDRPFQGTAFEQRPFGAETADTFSIKEPAPDVPYGPMPTAYLPASSQIPSAKSEASGDRDALRSALREAAQTTADVAHRLQNHVASLAWRREASLHLQAKIDAVRRETQTAYGAMTSENNQLSSEIAVARAIRNRQDIEPEDRKDLHADFCVQDLYFQIYRIYNLSVEEYAAQVATTVGRIVADLPYTVLALDEVTALLQASARALAELSQELGGDEIDLSGRPPSFGAESMPGGDGQTSAHAAGRPPKDDYLGGAVPTPAELEAFWSTQNASPTEEHTQQVGLYRWLNGHHLWKLCLQFAGDHLRDAHRLVADERPEAAARSLNAATTYERGTPAAMWYAANSPSIAYREKIRPSMVRVTKLVDADSFSGVQNADYTRVQAAWKDLIDVLHDTYGTDASEWPGLLRESVRSYHQADVQSEEHHVQIAFSKVGTNVPSVAQQMRQAHLPDGVNPMSAVEVLRNMADAKREELSL
jgi:uncharacterized protein (UPF0212 family)